YVNVANNVGIGAGGGIVFGGGANILQYISPWLVDYGSFTVTGDLAANGNLSIPSGSMFMQSATPGVGTIYCSGVRVDGRGVETLGNIRFIGQGAYTAGNQGTFITWDHIVDSRPWAMGVA